MAYFLFINGGVANGNLGTLSNWRNSNASHANLSAAVGLPGAADIAWFGNASETVTTGTLAAAAIIIGGGGLTVSGGTFSNTVDWSNGNVTINGGIFSGVNTIDAASITNGTFAAEVDGNGPTFGGGTFNGPVSISGGATFNAGTFNSTVTDVGSSSFIGGTFNGGVATFGSIFGGIFTNSVTVDGGGQVLAGTFSGDLVIIGATLNNTGGGPISVTGRISVDGGSTFLYAPSAVGVAPANKVLVGTTNLGVPGTAPAGSGSGHFIGI